mmetsp:Transcript_6906/g.13848  ORF Transcript_6906/g.13848 Transcript_6906/m.13848 type:complete len:251 (-) Transcript_6906:7206-7958(-)
MENEILVLVNLTSLHIVDHIALPVGWKFPNLAGDSPLGFVVRWQNLNIQSLAAYDLVTLRVVQPQIIHRDDTLVQISSLRVPVFLRQVGEVFNRLGAICQGARDDNLGVEDPCTRQQRYSIERVELDEATVAHDADLDVFPLHAPTAVDIRDTHPDHLVGRILVNHRLVGNADHRGVNLALKRNGNGNTVRLCHSLLQDVLASLKLNAVAGVTLVRHFNNQSVDAIYVLVTEVHKTRKRNVHILHASLEA